MQIIHGDSLHKLKELSENSIDAVVTDPPYGLSFMGKKWDYDVPSVELWREVLRVLKPGGHVLSFGGTRTYHRMVVNMEDAGFEIRDQVQWIYGSGFPKSLDVSKAIDKKNGISDWKETTPNPAWRAGNGKYATTSTGWDKPQRPPKPVVESDEAKQWQGFGTALKPANEPICLARKPLSEKTVALNVLRWGCGALNIDGSRIGYEAKDLEVVKATIERMKKSNNQNGVNKGAFQASKELVPNDPSKGRWPANVLFDEDAAAVLDEQSGTLKSGARKASVKVESGVTFQTGGVSPCESSIGGASRFFYVAKASKRERNAGLDKTDLIWENDAWEKEDLKLLMANILQLAKDISDDILMDAFSWSTGQFGLSITAQSQTAMTYTIKTALKLITELKTSNAFQSSNIKESIQDAIRMIEASGLSLVESVEFTKTWSLNTTSEKTASLLGAVSALLPMLLQIKGFAKSGNFHSTVKPTRLMEYLIKLITPPNGTVLDPFMGSGSTGVACKNLGFEFIGIELNEEYVEIAKKRIEHVTL